MSEGSNRRWRGRSGQGQATKSFIGHGKEFGFYPKWGSLRGFKQQNEGITLAAAWSMEPRERKQEECYGSNPSER